MHAHPKFWTFCEIAACDPGRAAFLESAPSADAIRAAVVSRFVAALESDQLPKLCIGMEKSSSRPSDHRVICQFQIGQGLYDQFFNANTGYRAQFRRDWRTGLAYNRSIITEMRSKLASLLPTEVSVRCLSPDYEDCGAFAVPRERIVQSLDPGLSKLWFCGRRIVGDGTVVQLPSGATGPRLHLDEQNSWATLARDESDAWLDVKGAFLGSGGPYQLKDPCERARMLQSTGEA